MAKKKQSRERSTKTSPKKKSTASADYSTAVKSKTSSQTQPEELGLTPLTDEPLPKNFYWFIAFMAFLFVAFLMTEPFYRQ